MLKEETIKAIKTLQKQYPNKRSALIPALHLAQNDAGYLSVEIQNQIAGLFEVDATEVRALVSFYDMFHEKPTGKHIIHVCKNISCMLRGCDSLLSTICSKLAIEPGQTSSDGAFTVIASECLGACDKAPMMLVNDTVVGPVSVDDIDAILEQAKQTTGHPSPICTGDINND